MELSFEQQLGFLILSNLHSNVKLNCDIWFSCRFVKITRRVEKMTSVLEYFMTRDWAYSNMNTQQLWLSLSPWDQQLFPFSFAEFDWDNYLKAYMLGLRQYILKDDLSTLPTDVTKLRRWVHSTLIKVELLQTRKMFLECRSTHYFKVGCFKFNWQDRLLSFKIICTDFRTF